MRFTKICEWVELKCTVNEIVVGGHKNYFNIFIILTQNLCNFKAVQIRHIYIQKQHVNMIILYVFNHIFAVAKSRTDFEVVLLRNYIFTFFANNTLK